MKTIFLILLLFVTSLGYNQEVLNLRFDLNYNNTTFENIIATDSCYYTTSYSIPQNSSRVDGGFIKINFDGSVDFAKHYINFTLNTQFISTHSDLINTLDNNFVILAKITNLSGQSHIKFHKIKPNGDTLLTNYISVIDSDGYEILNVNTILQNSDSTFYNVVGIENPSNLIAGVALLKLSSTGELLWRKYFWGLGVSNYRLIKANSLLKYDEDKLLIGASLIHIPYGGSQPILQRFHTKLIMTDTLGNLLWERTYWEDTINPEVNGLTKTTDGDVLYGGVYGRFNDVHNGIEYKAQLTKLDADFDLEWRIIFDKWGSYNYTFNNILAVNDSEFVAIGNIRDHENWDHPTDYHIISYGYLVKFNSQGNVLWERKYTKVPHFDGESNWATHILYDVALTPDNGFVMVGESSNYYTNNGVSPGQQGWLK